MSIQYAQAKELEAITKKFQAQVCWLRSDIFDIIVCVCSGEFAYIFSMILELCRIFVGYSMPISDDFFGHFLLFMISLAAA